jgi:5-methylcytosine-specific restriction endonuclease McrA
MWQRRTRSSKRKIGGVATIRRDSYGTVSGFNTKDGWWEIRKKVVQRAGGKCESRLAGGVRCSAPAVDCHHIRPLSQGGTTTMANLLMLCKGCHERRHTHMFMKRK